MSRAKQYTYDGGSLWFDYKNPVATVEQLELLSDLTETPIDDLLDGDIGQKECARRLFAFDGLVPEHVLERRRQRIEAQRHAPPCRWTLIDPEHQCQGFSTRHHFVPRWLMLLLKDYDLYSARSLCTIPLCLSSHRDLHMRGGTPKSIIACLDERERAFAQGMLEELQDQHPAVFDLIAQGDSNAYEAQLISDYLSGRLQAPHPDAKWAPGVHGEPGWSTWSTVATDEDFNRVAV